MYKAVVWTGSDRLEIREKSLLQLQPGPGQVLLKIRAAGICGTDLHILSGKHPEAKPPLVPGHEFAGEVVEIGTGVDPTFLYARVGSDSYIGCGRCQSCLTRQPQLCETGTRELGITLDGGWAEYIVVPQENLYRLPEGVDFSEAGAGCMLNCPMAAIERVRVAPGDVVLILGDGPSSLIMVQLARLKGAQTIVVAGHRPIRLDLARKLGADLTVDTGSGDLDAVIRSLPHSPQVVIDAVGTSKTFRQALILAGRRARVHLFGLPGEPMAGLPMETLLFKELTIVSSTGDPRLWPTAMTLMSQGLLKVAPIINYRFSLDRAAEALEFVRTHRQQVIKAIFEMNA
jgi:L-gulonate 5-dehydrogenase